MEPQETICCFDNTKKCCKNRKNCLGIVAIILLVTFALVLGLIIGAALSIVILAALPAIIVLAIVLGLFFILSLILMACKKEKCCK